MQDAIKSLSADSFTDEPPSKDEEIGMALHLDNENFPNVEISLYRYNDSLCLAVVDGDPVPLVSRSSVMNLVEAVQAIVLNKIGTSNFVRNRRGGNLPPATPG